MPLASVLQFVATTLNGTTSAYLPAVEAFITPQAGAVIETPIVAVWTRAEDEKRATMTRNGLTPAAAGFKKSTHQIELYIKAVGNQDAPNVDVAFPTLLDAVKAQLRSVVMPFTLEDAATGVESNVTQIGESFKTQIGTVAATRDQRQYIWRAQITTPVEEWFQS